MGVAGLQSTDSAPPPPNQGALKVNVDVAFNGETGEAAVGGIVRDHFGQPHAMTWRLVGRCREAEEA
jgi:hypothetical protein